MSTDADRPSLTVARERADLGLPIGRPTRFRFFKRIVLRISWLFLNHQIAVNHGLIDAVAGLEQQLADLRDQHHVAATGNESALRQLEQQLAELRDQQHLAAAGMIERLDLGLRQAFQEIGDHIAQARVDQTDLARQVLQLDARILQLDARIDPLDTVIPALQKIEDTLSHETTEMHLARAEANIVIDRVRRALPEPVDLSAIRDTSSAWDDLYLPFENVFRGSSVLIKSRVSVYLADLQAIDRADRTVLDIGCGRGDWLELLAEEGIDAYGVDIDEQSIELALSSKLDARHTDAFAHLAEVPAGSIAAITALHFVEHISTNDLIALLDLSFRALMSGGLLILETPNPENLVVGITEFYMDPTHRNPIPPPLLAFLTGSRGFTDTSIRRLRRGTLNPAPESALATLDPALAPIIALLQEHLLAGEDYAVLARRA